MDTLERDRDARVQTDGLRDLAPKYAVDFSNDTPGEIVLRARDGQNVASAIASLRADGYEAEETGPGTITVRT